MAKTTHTPGPWTAGHTPHYLRMGQKGNPLTIRSPHNTEEIATVWTCCMPTEANAILISCAPDLLKELKQTVYELKEWRDYWTNEADSFNHPSQEQEYGMCKDRAARLTEQIQAIESLIKKAEGAN